MNNIYKIAFIKEEISNIDNLKVQEHKEKDLDIEMSLSLSVGVTNKDHNSIKFKPEVKMSVDGSTFVHFSISTTFEINKKYWLKYTSEDGKSLIIPKKIAITFFDESISVLRGALFYASKPKQKNKTPIILPSINSKELILSDVSVLFD